jgi:hypothetical protein
MKFHIKLMLPTYSFPSKVIHVCYICSFHSATNRTSRRPAFLTLVWYPPPATHIYYFVLGWLQRTGILCKMDPLFFQHAAHISYSNIMCLSETKWSGGRGTKLMSKWLVCVKGECNRNISGLSFGTFGNTTSNVITLPHVKILYITNMARLYVPFYI